MKQIKSFKIFEGMEETVYRDCVNEGYTPATLKQTGKLITQGKIPKQWYNVAEVFVPFNIRKITKKECLNLKEFVNKRGRVSILDNWDSDCYFSASNRSVDLNGGRLVGVKFK